jgi:hypothetical protein
VNAIVPGRILFSQKEMSENKTCFQNKSTPQRSLIFFPISSKLSTTKGLGIKLTFQQVCQTYLYFSFLVVWDAVVSLNHSSGK